MKTKKVLSPGIVILLVSLTLFLSARAPAVAAAMLTITPSDDAYVSSSYPDGNYGFEDSLRLQRTDSESFDVYLKFNVTDVNGAVQSAKVRLYAYDGSDEAASIYAVSNNYRDQNIPWNQDDLTWRNAPTLTGAPLQTLGPVSRDNRWVEFDVTTAVSGNGTYSFGLTTTSSNNVYYRSMEGDSHGPVLIIEVGRAPTSEPPATTTRRATSEPPATTTRPPTAEPTATATTLPTSEPTTTTPPTAQPTATATTPPTAEPTATATAPPTAEPTATATTPPTAEPTATATAPPTSEPTATATMLPTPEPSTTPPATPTGQSFYRNMWLSPQEVAGLPTTGAAWDNLLSAAQEDTSGPNISNQDDKTDVYVLAKALVYARTGQTNYRDQVVAAIQAAIGTEKGGRTLALGRNLAAYIIAADLVNLPAVNAAVDQQFRTWLGQVLTEELDGRTLRSTHEDRPNNWGTHAGASRVAIALYLGDTAELNQAATVFKGWLGDRNAYAGFKYGDLWWQCDPDHPVGINPAGCTIDGHNVDGVVPDDQRRGGPFTWPAPKENYAWGGLQGAVVQAELLHRAGFPAWQWQDQAILRAVTWLYEQNSFPAEGDDEWQPWLVNYVYGTSFLAAMPASPGKGMGWTDWTHNR